MEIPSFLGEGEKKRSGAVISGDDISNITGSDGLDIYYDAGDPANAYLGGQTYNLTDGGELIGYVPEPTSIALLLTGLAGVMVARRRKRA